MEEVDTLKWVFSFSFNQPISINREKKIGADKSEKNNSLIKS